MEDHLLAEKKDHIGWLIFNRPEKHNAVSYEMWQGIPQILADFEQDPEVRVVVLKGAGEKSFISGGDISQFGEKRDTAEAIGVYDKAIGKAMETLMGLEKPTIAMIHGFCIGGGLQTALSCDLRFATEPSLFGVPAARLGVGYSYRGAERMAQLVGPAWAKEIFFTGRLFSTTEVREMGLLNRVVPDIQALEELVDQYAEMIAQNAPLTIKAVKVAIEEHAKNPDHRDMERVNQLVKDCMYSEDYREGRTAFMEKRPPQFQGK